MQVVADPSPGQYVEVRMVAFKSKPDSCGRGISRIEGVVSGYTYNVVIRNALLVTSHDIGRHSHIREHPLQLLRKRVSPDDDLAA